LKGTSLTGSGNTPLNGIFSALKGSGFVAKPEDWTWSSFRHYATGVEGRVEIESPWSAMRRGSQLPEYLRYQEKAG
jgi:hypothetical protein